MTQWICETCGIEHPEGDAPPSACAICRDDRQYLTPAGQVWTTPEEQAGSRTVTVEELEPDLYAITVDPKVGIGQRGLLVRTPAGNLLWEPPGYLDDAFVARVRELGGIAAVAASHPHLVGRAVSWSRLFDVPFYFNGSDRRWLMRPDPGVVFWSGTQAVLPGIDLVQCGGHFPGSGVAHWAAGAGGRGVLLTGDTIFINADRASVTFMRSYPNLIPLPERLVRQIVAAVEPLNFDRVYAGFAGPVLTSDAKQTIRFSADRYVGWITDTIRDPDDPGPAR